jgi:hypothetical protein
MLNTVKNPYFIRLNHMRQESPLPSVETSSLRDFGLRFDSTEKVEYEITADKLRPFHIPRALGRNRTCIASFGGRHPIH